jgi:tripartite-type tricarboxylate transporter receptor subunit TctC
MLFPRSRFLRLVGVAALTLILIDSHNAWSQPARTMKFVVPYPAGGAVDFLARLLAEHISRMQGLTVLVENRAGAAAVICRERSVIAEPRFAHPSRRFDSQTS